DQTVTALQVKSYTFPAHAGDILSARLAQYSTATSPLPSGYNANLFVYGADGKIVMSGSGATSLPVALQTRGAPFIRGDFTVTTEGSVTVIVFDASNQAGTFAVSLTRFNNGGCGASGSLSCGAVSRGSIDLPAEVDTFSVSLTAGDVVSVRVAATDPNST